MDSLTHGHRNQGEQTDDSKTTSMSLDQSLDRVATLIAVGAIGIDEAFRHPQRELLVETVGQIRRTRLVKFIAHRMAEDVYNEAKTEEQYAQKNKT